MPHRTLIQKWLWLNIVMLIFMIILGGVTRLEDAGLSITEWAPLAGTLPPFGHADWIQLFNQYKTSPEFQKVNFMMTLAEFKYIFWLEYLHRLWGRIFGLMFFLPAFYFWTKGWLSLRQKNQIRVLTLLGIAQAFMGWYMVKSGLVNDPHVSHFRLAGHFILALAILGVLLWMIFDQWDQPGLKINILWLGGTSDFLLTTIVYGAFVAGLDAGLLYNETFPQMGSTFIPQDFWVPGQGFWYTIFNNPVAIQFTHRWLAMITTVLVLCLAIHIWRRHKLVACMLIAGVLTQAILGVITLFSHVNTWIAEVHQLGAVFLFSMMIYVWHRRCQFQG